MFPTKAFPPKAFTPRVFVRKGATSPTTPPTVFRKTRLGIVRRASNA